MFSRLRDGDEVAFTSWRVIDRKTVAISKFKEMVSFAYTVLSKYPILHRDLLLLFEGYTLLSKDALNGAYLYGWMMIETFLDELWEEYVESLQLNRVDKDSLKHHDRWTGYHQIEIFSILNRLDLNSRTLLNRLRRIRNKIIHDRYNALMNEAEECLFTAYKILRNRVKNSESPFTGIGKTS
jgi:hypothetical protein